MVRTKKKYWRYGVVYLNDMAVVDIQLPKRPDTFLHLLEYLESIIDSRRTKKTAFIWGMQELLRMMQYNLVIYVQLKARYYYILIQ